MPGKAKQTVINPCRTQDCHGSAQGGLFPLCYHQISGGQNNEPETEHKTADTLRTYGGTLGSLMFFRFPLPFMPPFMDFDFSGLVEIIGGFTMGLRRSGNYYPENYPENTLAGQLLWPGPENFKTLC